MPRRSKSYLCVLGLWLGAVSPAIASGQAAVEHAKIAIVKIQDAIVATDEGKREFDALQARFAPKENDLKALNDEVEAMKKDLQTRGDKLNEEQRNQEVKALETKQKTLQHNFEDAQNEFQQAQQEVVNRIGKKMLDVLEKYAKGNGYNLILDVSNPQTPVLWASEGMDVTRQLVDAYNAQFPLAPAAAAPGRSSATTPRKP